VGLEAEQVSAALVAGMAVNVEAVALVLGQEQTLRHQRVTELEDSSELSGGRIELSHLLIQVIYKCGLKII
jgi:hypothetical protein